MKRFVGLFCVVALLHGVAGCGGGSGSAQSRHEYLSEMSMEGPSAATDMVDTVAVAIAGGQSAADAVTHTPEQSPAGTPSSSVRKIVYTASLCLVVESFEGIAQGIVGMSERFGGFVASANIQGSSGSQRSGTWKLRIPSVQYRAFLDSAGTMGEVTSLNEQTQEVTAEYFDVEARIRNKQTEEKRLSAILEERTGKLDDVLSVEKEISRVRGEVEVLQGRLRVLKDLTSYSTVTIQVREVKNYVPPAAPTFATQISRQWAATLNQLSQAGQSFVLWVVALGPWLVVLALPALLLTWLVRRRFRPEAA